MRSTTLVLAVGLLASPLALLASPDNTAEAAGSPQLAAAQTGDTVNGHVLTDAPVPTVGPAGVSPVDRVAGEGGRTLDAGPANSTPFSNAPTGTLSSGGSQTSNTDRVNAPSDGSGVTPTSGSSEALGRQVQRCCRTFLQACEIKSGDDILHHEATLRHVQHSEVGIDATDRT